MRRIIIILLVLLAAIGKADAQQHPKYQLTGYSPTRLGFFLMQRGGKIQTIYTPKFFPGMPSGPVQAVYFRAMLGPYHTQSTATYQRFIVRLGSTSDTSWPTGQAYDTFKTELITIHDGPLTVYGTNYNTDTTGQWVRFPVNGRFAYNRSPFVFELQRPPTATDYGVVPAAYSHDATGTRRSLNGNFDSLRSPSQPTINMMDIGLDIGTTGVEAQGNFAAIGVFPNPASGPSLHVSLQMRSAVRSLSVRLLSATGQLVRQAAYKDEGREIFRQLDIAGLAPGHYTLELDADGERLARQVVIR